jgi:predicted porin
MGWHGNFFLGRWDMPFKQTQVLAVDPFGDLTIADMTGVAARQGGFSNRASNVVQYWTPALAGFIARLAVTSNEGKSDAPAVAGTAAGANPRMYGGSLEWASGPFFASYAYEKHKDSTGNVVATQGTDETGHGVSGKYTIGGHEISAQYGQYSRTDTETQKSWMLGLRSTFGVHQILAGYRRSSDGGVTGTDQPRCDSWGLGYKYLWDRNLDFIVLATKVNNKTGGLCDFGSNAVGAAAIADGGDPRGFGAGLRYSF